MKLNKKSQYALLLIIYLSRSGRASLGSISESLNISLTFLQQVARKLRMSDLIRSVMGAGGGYELCSDPTVIQVLSAVGTTIVMPLHEYSQLKRGDTEDRVLAHTAWRMSQGLKPILDLKVRNLVSQLVAIENKAFAAPALSKAHN